MLSNLRPAHDCAPGVLALSSHLPIPGAGLLPVNSYLITATEPILIDTGLAHDRGPLLDAVQGRIDLADLGWIVVTHDDRDHAGNLRDLLIAAPNATMVTNGLTLARLGEEWDVPPHRTLRVNPGARVRLGDRELGFLRPPSFDSPATLAVYDVTARALFTSDGFGSVVPIPADDAADLREDDYLAGMTLFTHANAPWVAMTAQHKFGALVDAVASLEPAHLLSSHSPDVHGRVRTVLEHMRTIPDRPPWAPDADEI